jgi:hypothetical protein
MEVMFRSVTGCTAGERLCLLQAPLPFQDELLLP